MPMFSVSMTFSNCTVTRTYDVEAATKAAAVAIVAIGKCECVHEEVDTGYCDEHDWEVVEK